MSPGTTLNLVNSIRQLIFSF
jgi:translation initiation factor 4E